MNPRQMKTGRGDDQEGEHQAERNEQVAPEGQHQRRQRVVDAQVADQDAGEGPQDRPRQGDQVAFGKGGGHWCWEWCIRFHDPRYCISLIFVRISFSSGIDGSSLLRKST